MTGDLLLGFEARNYRSIRQAQRITMTRSQRNADPRFGWPDVAPAVALFGPNASGKSNLLGALRTMHRIIEFSATWTDRPLPFDPFLLAPEVEPTTRFEMDAVIGGVRYSYAFEYDAHTVHHERLHSWPRGRQRTLYERGSDVPDEWYFGDSLNGPNQALAKATRSDALFLSTARLLNHEVLGPLHESFTRLVRFVGADTSERLLDETLDAIQRDPSLLNRVSGLVRRADLGVMSIEIEEDEVAQRVRESAREIIEAVQKSSPGEVQFVLDGPERTLVPRLRHEASHGAVSLPFSSESLGTRNFIALLGPVLARLVDGGVLVVDELDTSLHARLVNELVRLFQDPRSNPRQAQLVLSTHDVTVMMNTGDYDVLKRDQIWFAKKEAGGETSVFSLASFPVRSTEAFSRSYLMDRYGALPRVDRDAFAAFLSEDDDLTVESGDGNGSHAAGS